MNDIFFALYIMGSLFAIGMSLYTVYNGFIEGFREALDVSNEAKVIFKFFFFFIFAITISLLFSWLAVGFQFVKAIRRIEQGE